MKIFRFRGGVHPEGRKEFTEERSITQLPLPGTLYVPVQQHIGAPARPVVTVGQRVAKGDLIAAPQGALSASVHAPTSGRIIDIDDYPAPHPSGLPVPTIVIESDGEDRWTDALESADPFVLTPEGRLARYLYGIEMPRKTLRLSLVEASEGKIGSALDQLILYCYHYDPSSRSYAPVAMNIMRAGGGASALLLGVVLSVLWLREARRRRGGDREPTET